MEEPDETDNTTLSSSRAGSDRVAQRREEAEEVYRSRAKGIIGMLVLEGASVEEAWDVMSTAVEKMLRRWDDLRDPGAWLTVVARKTFIKSRTGNRPFPVEFIGDLLPSVDDPGLTVWEDQQQREVLFSALTEGQRTVMQMLVDGYTQVEIAQHLELSAAAVRKSVQRARERLQVAAEALRSSGIRKSCASTASHGGEDS